MEKIVNNRSFTNLHTFEKVSTRFKFWKNKTVKDGEKNIRVNACATVHRTQENAKDKKNQRKKNCTFDFWFALLLVGPEEKPLENFSSWETRSNIPRAPGGRPLFNPSALSFP